MSAQTTITSSARPAPAGASVAPSQTRSRRDELRVLAPHNPVALVYAAMLALGIALFLSRTAMPNILVAPSAAILATVLWTLYTLPWLVFINHRELFSHLSRRTAVLGFLWGGFVATSVMAVNANTAMISIYTKINPELSAQWSAALSASWIEEIACGLGIVTVLYALRKRLRSPFEMMILGAFVGLGFQIVEDWMYAVHAVGQAFGQHALLDVAQSFFVRAFIAGWWSHTLWTGLFGAGLGYLMSRDVPRKPLMAATLIFAAMGLHFLWDSPLLGRFEIVGALVKGAIAVAVYVWAYRRAVATERGWVRVALAPEVANGRVAQRDVDALATTYRKRKHEWKEARAAHGKDAGDALRSYQASLVDLADALDDSRGADTPDVLAARQQVMATRSG